MNLENDEERFLKDLISHAKKGQDKWRETLEEAEIPINRSLKETHTEFGPYQRDEDEIIKNFFDRDIIKIKVKEREIHQSLEENRKSKKKDLLKGIGLNEEKIDEILQELDIQP